MINELCCWFSTMAGLLSLFGGGVNRIGLSPSTRPFSLSLSLSFAESLKEELIRDNGRGDVFVLPFFLSFLPSFLL